MTGILQKPRCIAIIGSNDPARAQELSLRNLEWSGQVGNLIGQALAQKGYHIVVYSSDPRFFEDDVVRGYIAAETEHQKLIEVRYSQHFEPPFFEKESNLDIFVMKPDVSPNLVRSFYQSLKEVDGAVLLGGGLSTLAAGLHLISQSKPILACSAFGGSAEIVWNAMAGESYLSPAELRKMARDDWDQEAALDAVDLFPIQVDRYRTAINEIIRQERKTDARFTIHSWIAAALFVMGSGCCALAWGITDISPGLLFLLTILTAGFTGGAGAIVRLVLDNMDKEKQSYVPFMRNIPLGLIAGTVSAFLFVLAQLAVNPTDLDNPVKVELLRRLVLFSFVIGLIAGITYERVFDQLRKINVVNPTAVQAPSDD